MTHYRDSAHYWCAVSPCINGPAASTPHRPAASANAHTHARPKKASGKDEGKGWWGKKSHQRSNSSPYLNVKKVGLTSILCRIDSFVIFMLINAKKIF